MPIFTLRPPEPERLGTYFRQPLLAGESGTVQTIAKMRELVDAALRDPAIIRLATDIVRHVAAYDEMGEAQAIYDWVKSNIRFTKDPATKEKLYPPAELLKICAGDCDDISMLMATLLMAIGYVARLVTVSANGSAPDQFSHVYAEAQVQGQWIPMDAARPDSLFATEPPMYYRKRAWSLVDDSYQDLNGTQRGLHGTKIYNHGGTVNLHLGEYPRYRSYLGSYVRVPQLGQDDGSGFWDSVVTAIPTITTGAANIIKAAEGPDPMASFRTPFTPYSPPAGYPTSQAWPASLASSFSMGSGALIAIGAGLLLLLVSRK
jgi:Transglutaminase-like superfamily